MRHFALRKIDIIIIISGLILTVFYAIGHKVDADVNQLLNNAYQLAEKSNLIPYGNVSSSGAKGNTPGAFLSLVSGGPMAIINSPYSALAFTAFLHLLALLMMVNVLKNYLSNFALTAFIMIFWLSPWRAGEVFLWNPAYIYFASAMHIWSAYHLSRKKSYTFSILHGLSLFIGLQVHASFVLLVFITLLLLLFRSMKVNWYGCVSGVIIGILSLTPYLIAGMENPDIFPRPGSNSGSSNGFLFFGLIKVYPLLKAIWYWCLFGSTIFQSHLFHEFNFSWLGSGYLKSGVEVLWTGIKYAFGISGILLSIKVNFRYFKKHKETFKIWRVRYFEGQNWLNYYIVAAMISLLMASAISPTEPIFWHLLYLWCFAIIPVCLYIDSKLKSGKEILVRRLVLAVGIFFLFSNFFAAMGSRKHDFFNQDFHKYYIEHYRIDS